MTSQIEKSYIGVDMAKAVFDIYSGKTKEIKTFVNDSAGIKSFLRYIRKEEAIHVVMEATGGYERTLMNALIQEEMDVSIVNPRQVRDFAKALGILAKTDAIDAKVIALFAEKTQPIPFQIHSKSQQKLAQLNARRRQLLEMIIMEKNRLDKVDTELKKSILRIIKVLEKELAAINTTIAEHIDADETQREKHTLLKTIKGIGNVVAANMLCDLPELGQLNAKQISALAGLAPYNRDSGTLRGKRTIWGGRAEVRTGLYMATLVAIRHNPQIKFFYQRLCNIGKQKKAAIVACMHKLLIIMNAMIKYKQPWKASFV